MDDAAMATAAGVSATTRPQLDLLMALAKYVDEPLPPPHMVVGVAVENVQL
jgi:hypothetical protein